MQVFISHASRDRELAKRLTAELSQAGFHVWNPDDEIYPGDNVPKKIGQAMEDSEVMIVLWTRNTRDSADKLARDVQFALTSGNYRGRLVPVSVGYKTFLARKDVPWVLKDFDPVYIEKESDSFERVVSRVRDLVKSNCNVAL